MDTTPYWMASEPLPEFGSIQRDIEVDVAIVGGGLTGITAAYLLKRAGAKVALLERQRCANADTGHTTAHLTFVTDLRLQEVNEASMIIQQAAHENANIIFGAVLDEEMEGRLKITVIATGFRPEAISSRKKSHASASSTAASKAPAGWNLVAGDTHGGNQIAIDRNDLDIPAYVRRKCEGQGR